eukprot:14154-Heterococcus_DN1.PRE.5
MADTRAHITLTTHTLRQRHAYTAAKPMITLAMLTTVSLQLALRVHQATYARYIAAACAIQKLKMDMTAASIVTVVLATAHGHTVVFAQR